MLFQRDIFFLPGIEKSVRKILRNKIFNDSAFIVCLCTKSNTKGMGEKHFRRNLHILYFSTKQKYITLSNVIYFNRNNKCYINTCDENKYLLNVNHQNLIIYNKYFFVQQPWYVETQIFLFKQPLILYIYIYIDTLECDVVLYFY